MQAVENDANEVLHRLSLFFFCAVPDEKIAIQLAKKSWKKYLGIGPSIQGGKIDEYKIVQVTEKVYFQWLRSRRFYESPAQLTPKFWTPFVDLELWREFLKKANAREALVIIWAMVLKIDHSSIAAALDVTEGTVRFRISKGLKLMSELKYMDNV